MNTKEGLKLANDVEQLRLQVGTFEAQIRQALSAPEKAIRECRDIGQRVMWEVSTLHKSHANDLEQLRQAHHDICTALDKLSRRVRALAGARTRKAKR